MVQIISSEQRVYDGGYPFDKNLIPTLESIGERIMVLGNPTLTSKSFSLKKNDVRSHGFSFRVLLPKIVNWDKRKGFLDKKGVFYKSILHGRVQSFVFKEHLIWLGNSFIIVFFPRGKSYFVESAMTGYNYAVSDLKDLLFGLQSFLGVRFLFGKEFRFRLNTNHHALIHNELARMYNRNKEKLRVYDDCGVFRLLIDFSDVDGVKFDEFEAVSREYAVRDNGVVRDFFKGLLDFPITPKMINKNFLATQQNTLAIHGLGDDVLKPLTEQIRLHLKVQRKTLKTLREMSCLFKDFRREFKK